MRTRPSGSAENQALGRLIRNVRKARGISQMELAQKLRQPQSFVSKIERGERHLEVVVFLEIAQHLKQNPYELLKDFVERRNDLDDE